MKKIFLWVLLTLYGWISVSAQCNCGSTSSMISFGEAGGTHQTIKKHHWKLEIQTEFRDLRSQENEETEPGHVHDHTHDHGSETELMSEFEPEKVFISLGRLHYGISDRLTLSLQQPYILLSSANKSVYGFGDMTFVSSMNILGKNDFSGTILAGMKMPTGIKSGLSGSENTVIGSGSFDPLAGMTLAKNWMKNNVRASMFYKFGTNGYGNVRTGHFLNPGLAYSRVLGKMNTACTSDSMETTQIKKSVWRLSASLSGEFYDQHKQNGVIVGSTGGYLIFSGIGTQVDFANWSIPLSVSVPVWQDLNGDQAENGIRVRLGIMRNI